MNFLLKGIKGNGIAIGITNGKYDQGIISITSSGNSYGLRGAGYAYGAVLSSSQQTSDNQPGIYGLTADETKSGIESVISANITYIIKY